MIRTIYTETLPALVQQESCHLAILSMKGLSSDAFYQSSTGESDLSNEYEHGLFLLPQLDFDQTYQVLSAVSVLIRKHNRAPLSRYFPY